MVVYIIVLIIIGTVLLTHIGSNYYYPETVEEYRRSGTGKAVFVTLILILVAGLRYQVGADYSSYIGNYQVYLSREIDIKENVEIAIALIARLGRIIYDNPQTYIFLCSLLTISLMIWTLKKYSMIFYVSVYLFIFLGCWLGSFNAVRQYLAAACLVFGLQYIIEGKVGRWILCVVAGTLCHTTAIITLPVYFLVRMKRDKKLYFVLLILFVVLFVSYDRIFGIMDAINGNTTRSVADRLYAQNGISLFRVIVAWVPVIFQFFPLRINDESMEERVILNYSLVNAVLLTAAMNSAYLGRVKIYFDFYNALAIPLILNHYEDETTWKSLTLVVLAMYFIYWLFEATGTYVVNYQCVLWK